MAIDVSAVPIDDPELEEESQCDECSKGMENGDECYCEKCWSDRGDRIDELEEKVEDLEERLEAAESGERDRRIQELEFKILRIKKGIKQSCELIPVLDRKLFQIDGVPIWDENWHLNI